MYLLDQLLFIYMCNVKIHICSKLTHVQLSRAATGLRTFLFLFVSVLSVVDFYVVYIVKIII